MAGLALTAGSTVANSIAQGDVSRARNDALAAERIRQRGFDRENAATNQHSQDLYTNFDAQQGAKAQQLGDFFAGQNATAGADNAATADAQSASIAPTSSNITLAEDARQGAKAQAFTDKQGAALGNLRAFGDILGTDSRLQARDATSIGQINGFKAGSSAVLPYELEAANGAGAGANLFGDLLGLGGNVLVAKGLSGGPTPPEDYVGKTYSAGTNMWAPPLPMPRPSPNGYSIY